MTSVSKLSHQIFTQTIYFAQGFKLSSYVTVFTQIIRCAQGLNSQTDSPWTLSTIYKSGSLDMSTTLHPDVYGHIYHVIN